MAILLWSAKPGAAWSRFLVGVCLTLGWMFVFVERGWAWSSLVPLAIVLVQTTIHWRLSRMSWNALRSPWSTPWKEMAALVLASLCILVAAGVASFEDERLWVSYLLMQGAMPLVLFKFGLWWTMDTLRDDSTNRFRVRMGQSTEKEPGSAARVYFLHWWRRIILRKASTPHEWLEMTSRFPQFMESLWWQRQGIQHWPDAMEWHAKMGTEGMLWFLRQRMETPPEELDDYSDASGIWSFVSTR